VLLDDDKSLFARGAVKSQWPAHRLPSDLDRQGRNDVSVDREVIRAEAIDKRFDEIGRELGGSLQKGEFIWAVGR
jgi:hypothetical protein